MKKNKINAILLLGSIFTSLFVSLGLSNNTKTVSAGETPTVEELKASIDSLLAEADNLFTDGGSTTDDYDYYEIDYIGYMIIHDSFNDYSGNLDSSNFEYAYDYYLTNKEQLINDAQSLKGARVACETNIEMLAAEIEGAINDAYDDFADITNGDQSLDSDLLSGFNNSKDSFVDEYNDYLSLSIYNFRDTFDGEYYSDDCEEAGKLLTAINSAAAQICENVVEVTFITDDYSTLDVKDGLISLISNSEETYLVDKNLPLTCVASFTDGYVLDSWTSDYDNSTSIKNTFIGAPFKDGIIKANSKEGIFSVSYVAGENVVGTVPVSNDYKIGTKITITNNIFTKQGYDFIGWSDGTDIYNAGSEYTIGDENVTFTAVFGHICNDIGFSKVLTNSGIYEKANYYLEEDLVMENNIGFNFEGVVRICLNGHILDLNGYQLYAANERIEIYDCCDDETSVHNYKVTENGLWVITDEAATKDLESLTARPSANDIIAVKGGAIVGGNSANGGGSIYAKFIKAQDVNFIGNFGIESNYTKGSVIYSDEAYVINCNFYGNRGTNGSAILGGLINLYNSEFKFNSAYTYDTEELGKGTIFCDGKLLVKNCVIQYNEAVEGGAIYLADSGVIATIIGSTITNNTASLNAGGICFGDAGCFVEGTLITLSDDSTKAVEELKVGDKVKSFNHETGEYESHAINYIYTNIGYLEYFTLVFESGTTLSIYDCHDLFNKEASKYVTISKSNYQEYIYKYFYNTTLNEGNGGYDRLIDVTFDSNVINYYSIYVTYTTNCIANGMLTCPDDAEYRLNIYSFDENLVADSEQLQADIDTYGLKSFEDCKLIESEEEYKMFDIKYYNIFIGKGLITERELDDYFYELHNCEEYGLNVVGKTLIIGKDTVIKNNKVNDTISNVYLNNGSQIAVINGTTNIDVGITLESNIGVFANNVYSNELGFTSDNTVYGIKKTLVNNTYTYSVSIIKEQPNKNNDYSVVIDDSIKDDYTYQWFIDLGTYELKDVDTTKYKYDYFDYAYGNTVYAAYENTAYDYSDGYVIDLYFNDSISFFVSFDCADNDLIAITKNCSIVSHKDIHYVVYSEDGELTLVSTNGSYCIYNVEFKIVNKLIAEANTKFGSTTLGDNNYYCAIYKNDVLAEESNYIKPNKISYTKDTGATGTDPTKVYQLEGRTITLPTNPYTKTDYKFVGWKDTSKTYDESSSYTVGNSNTTLTASFTEKKAVVITETAQTYTYNTSKQAFELKGTDKDLENLVVKYYVAGEWTTTAPSNANSYNVKITRLEDSEYKAYTKEITNGLVINKYVVSDNDVTFATNDFTYNGTDQFDDVTASYKNAVGDTVELFLDEISARVNYYVGDDFLEAGIYDVCFIFDTNEESNNYVFESTSSDYIYTEFEMKKKEVTISWSEDNYTYNGQTQTVTASYKDINNQEVALTVTTDKTFKDAGNYLVTASFANSETNYKLPTVLTKSYTINTIKVNEPVASGTYTYNGQVQTVAVSGVENYMSTTDSLSQTNAGVHTITYTLDSNYSWVDGNDGKVTWEIKKANAQITLNQETIEKIYGQTIELPTATSNFGEVVCDKVSSDLVNAGSYTITYTVNATNNYNGDTKNLNVIINKLAVNEPVVVGTYKYEGNQIEVSLTGVESYMTTANSLVVNNAGVYTITYTLDSNHTWANGSDGIISFEVNKSSVISTDEESQINNVEVSTENGFSNDITVVVEVTAEVEVETKELTVDYYNLDNEDIKLENNEKVGVIFDVKLIQTVNGVSKVIQPEDIAPGTTIKVKMLIPESVDISKVTRILHVHSKDDIETIEFDPSLVDENGYYEIEVDRLSEFAFVYKTNGSLIHLLLILLLCMLIGFVGVMWYVFKVRTFKTENKTNVLPIIGYSVHATLLTVLVILADCNICYLLAFVNLIVLITFIATYLYYKEKKPEHVELVK